MVTVMPLMVGGAESYLGWNRNQLGWLASGEMLGIALASLILFLYNDRIKHKSAAIIGLSGMLICNILCIFLPPPMVLIALRVVAGVFGGLAYASGISYLAGIPNSDDGYSNYIIIYSILSGIYLWIFPFLLIKFGYQVGFVILSLQCGLALILGRNALSRYPQADLVIGQVLKKSNFAIPLVVFGILLVFLFFQTGHSGIYAFAERLGDEYQVSPVWIGRALSLSILAGIPAGMLNIWMSKYYRAPIRISIGLTALFLGLLFLWQGDKWSFSFITGIIILEFGFGIVLPSLFSWIALYDPTGKWVTLGTVLNWIGQGIGPIFAAFMVLESSYKNILLLPILFLGLSFLLAIYFGRNKYKRT